MGGLSVVLPVFNAEKYLRSSLVALVEQSEHPDELVIVDDGSTDDSLKIIDEFVFPFPVIVHSQENQGPGPARNTGIDLATQDYVYFLDSDDMLAPDAIERFKQVFEDEPEVECVLISGDLFLDEGNIDRSCFPDHSRGLPAGRADRKKIISCFCEQGRWTVNAFLYVTKRSIWKEKGLKFHGYFHEDTELFYRLMLSVDEFFVLDEVLYFKRVRPSSIMTGAKSDQHLKGAEVLLASLTEKKNSLSRLERRFLSIASALAAVKYVAISKGLNEKIDYRLIFSNFIAYPDVRYVLKLAVLFFPGGGRVWDSAKRIPELIKIRN